MKGLRKILRVSWTAKKTNEWVLNKAGVKRRKQGNCLEKEIMLALTLFTLHFSIK